MLKSMTAYGRSAKETSFGRLTCEILSVNRKHLEANVFLPKEFIRFDADVKKWISSEVGRGQVTVRFVVVFQENTPLSVSANLPLALKIQQASESLAKELGLPSAHELTLKMLSEQPGVLMFDEQMEDEELYRNALKEVFDEAMAKFLEMKTKEGHAIFEDIFQRLQILQQGIEKIALYAPHATIRYREKLTERLQEWLQGDLENDERILKEIGIFAERMDISEEITLFQSHLKQFLEVMSAEKGGGAKTLEFLLQELNREVNTIGSKSSEIEIAKLVVEMKSTLERIREIIQNVE